jgi:hypothetical protein
MPDLYGFDASQVDPSVEFEPIPAGKYVVMITESQEKENRSGSGSYLQFTFQILEGEYKGRLVWARLNLQHPNVTAVQIAKAELSAICRAVGILKPTNSEQLHHLPLVITVKCKKRKDSDELTNEIRGYARRELPGSGAAPAQPANGTPPWRRPPVAEAAR